MSDLQELIHTNAHNAFAIGVRTEQERIIKFAENRICFDHKNGCSHSACYAMSDLIDLIKGEQK
jgi:hypothetical protein